MIGCPFRKIPSGLDPHHAALVLAKADHRTTARWRQELSGTVAQRLDLEHEIYHAVSQLRILGFKPLK
jgi:hypothetical protein